MGSGASRRGRPDGRRVVQQSRLESGLLADLPQCGLVGEFVPVDVPAGRDVDSESLVLVEGGRAVVDDVDGRGEVTRRLHALASPEARLNVGRAERK